MNGFTMLADSYRKLARDGEITEEQAEKKTRIYEFLATCDNEDKSTLYRSSAFNDLIRSQIDIGIDELVEDGTLTEEQAYTVKDCLYSVMIK